jgi:hypothetical protein
MCISFIHELAVHLIHKIFIVETCIKEKLHKNHLGNLEYVFRRCTSFEIKHADEFKEVILTPTVTFYKFHAEV